MIKVDTVDNNNNKGEETMQKQINHSHEVQSELIDIIMNFDGISHTVIDCCNLVITGFPSRIDSFEDYLSAIDFDLNFGN